MNDIDYGAPTMLRMPREMARVIAENLQAFAAHEDAVAQRCATAQARETAMARRDVLRSYAAGLMDHAT